MMAATLPALPLMETAPAPSSVFPPVVAFPWTPADLAFVALRMEATLQVGALGPAEVRATIDTVRVIGDDLRRFEVCDINDDLVKMCAAARLLLQTCAEVESVRVVAQMPSLKGLVPEDARDWQHVWEVHEDGYVDYHASRVVPGTCRFEERRSEDCLFVLAPGGRWIEEGV